MHDKFDLLPARQYFVTQHWLAYKNATDTKAHFGHDCTSTHVRRLILRCLAFSRLAAFALFSPFTKKCSLVTK